MSTGEALRVRAAMKPIATVPRALRTVDVATGEAAVAHHQRSDVCAVPAAGIVAEAMVALVLADVGAGEVRWRLGHRDPAQRRDLPGHAEVSVVLRAGPRVVLVGPMGAGKSTVAGLLAARWGARVRDTDAGHRGGRGQNDLGDLRGRRRAALPRTRASGRRRGAGRAHGVLALGGGAVLDPGTRDAAGRAQGGVPQRRPRRRSQAGRSRRRAPAAARQRPRARQGAARRAAARSTRRSPASTSTPTAGPPRTWPTTWPRPSRRQEAEGR